MKIKAECKSINAPLPVIDAENGGVSIRAIGCEKYMSVLRYGQYGQVGADGVRREKEAVQYDVQHLVQAEQDSEQDIKQSIINYCREPKTTKEIVEYFGFANRLYFKRHFLDEMLEQGQLKMTLPKSQQARNKNIIRKLRYIMFVILFEMNMM